MTQQIHHIKQKVFDVSFVNEPEGLNFQKRFSDFIKNELTAVTEKCLAEFDSPKVQMINRLELNLGTIPYEKYESVFLKTYEEIFTKELRNKLFVEGPDNEEDPDAGESLVGLIKHFLIKGYMPWNYSNEKWNSFSDLFDQVLSNEPQLLLDQIDCILESQSIRFRLIQQLEDDSIIKFVRQVEPTQSETIISFHHNWMRVQKRKKVFPDNVSLLSTTFWEI
ncbi:MAG: contractile injection system tape measure protein, partial [Ekhidna sp.]